MRVLVIELEKRPRPVCTTPEKGSVGDCTDETQVKGTDIGSILARYGGNLAELARWRGTMSFGDQPVCNLEDALDALEAANMAISALPNTPFATLDEALSALKDGTFYDKVNGSVKEEPVKEEPVKKEPVKEEPVKETADETKSSEA